MAGNFFQKEAKADFSFNLSFVLNPSISELMGSHVDYFLGEKTRHVWDSIQKTNKF